MPNLPVQQLPFLFLNMYENEKATHVEGNIFFGSSNGWLHTKDHNGSSICLMNPLTSRIIQITPYPGHAFSRKNIVLSPHTSKNDCVAVAFYDGTKLAYCKCQVEKWKSLSDDLTNVEDIIFHQGKLYALLEGLGLAIYNCENINPTNITRIASPHSTDLACSRYLVESSGQELMLVVKETRCAYAMYAQLPGARETLFHLYKLDPVKQGWDRVKSIGDDVIFVDRMSSISVSCRSFPGFKGNRIYFINEACCGYHWQEKSNIEVFNLDDETTESFIRF